MPRLLDLKCPSCSEVLEDIFMMKVPDVIYHYPCGVEMQEMVGLRSSRGKAQWSDKDSVVVFKDASGQIRYPGRNDAATPPGCERVVMRSLREVERFERQHGVCNEAMHYDSGSGGPS